MRDAFDLLYEEGLSIPSSCLSAYTIASLAARHGPLP